MTDDPSPAAADADGAFVGRRLPVQLAGFVLAGVALQLVLPHLSERLGLVLACLPIAAAGGYAWVGFRRQSRAHHGRSRAGLTLGAASSGLLGLAYLLYTLDALLGPGPLTSGAADVASIAAAAVAVPALILAVPPFPDGLTRITHVVEVATVAASLFATTWLFVLAPASAAMPVDDKVVLVLTVAAEIVAGALALMLMSHTAPGRNRSLWLLAAGLGLFALAAVGGVHTRADELPWYADGLGAVYLIAGLTIGLASRDTVGPADTTGWRPYTGFWSALSHLPVAISIGCVGVEFSRSGTLSAVLVWALLASSGLALVRHLLHLMIVRRLLSDLDDQRRRLDRLAHHDLLTGLPNRAAFQPHAEAALTAAAAGAGVAVLMLDLDGFKTVNDTLGHAAGDALLVGVGERLGAALRPGDLAARLGGDEFVLVLTGLAGPAEATAIGERILAGLAAPITLGGADRQVRGSAGISLATGPDRGLTQMLHEADTALYAAKAAGKGVVRLHATPPAPTPDITTRDTTTRDTTTRDTTASVATTPDTTALAAAAPGIPNSG